MAKVFTVQITDEEMRAFELIVPDPDEWVQNAVLNKVRKCLNYVAERVANDIGNMLDPEDVSAIEALIVSEGSVMKQPKHYSDTVKREIAKRTKMLTRVERDNAEIQELLQQ